MEEQGISSFPFRGYIYIFTDPAIVEFKLLFAEHVSEEEG
jgi:hypothetical protein